MVYTPLSRPDVVYHFLLFFSGFSGMQHSFFLCDLRVGRQTERGGVQRVPTTPDPNTSAEAWRYKWELYRDTNWWCTYYFQPTGRHTILLLQSIVMEVGCVSRCFSKVSGSGVDLTLLKVVVYTLLSLALHSWPPVSGWRCPQFLHKVSNPDLFFCLATYNLGRSYPLKMWKPLCDVMML